MKYTNNFAKIAVISLIVVAFFAHVFLVPFPETSSAFVIECLDGDDCRVWSPYKPYWLYQQHLAGIDAPEGGEEGAAQAKAQLEDWVKWRWVTIVNKPEYQAYPNNSSQARKLWGYDPDT